MIHQVYLPESTKKKLRAVVILQMRLLHYAAQTTKFDNDKCKEYLMKFKEYRENSPDIVDWICKAPKSRKEYIKAFAEEANLDEKQKLVSRLSHDVMLLFKLSPNNKSFNIAEKSLEPFRAKKDSWQSYCSKFLLMFYNELTEEKLPYYFFPENNNDFTRQDFLNAFIAANKKLYVCAVCDDSSYYTVSNTYVRSEIEHYFPKSIYPHLACHPYNLIPICHLCNAFIHRDIDPLDTKDKVRRRLGDIFLPYTNELGLGARTYAKVELGKGGTLTQFSTLLSRDGSNLRQRIVAFQDVYDIPGRWNGRKGADKIGEALFRRIRQFLRSQPVPASDNMPLVLLEILDQLLYHLSDERNDEGRDPLTFAMTWWLATLINEEVEPGKIESSALMKEVVDWLGLDIDANAMRAQMAKTLRGLVK